MKKFLIGLTILGGLTLGGIALAKGRTRRIFGIQPDDGDGFAFGESVAGLSPQGSFDLTDDGLQAMGLRKGDVLVIRVDTAPWAYDMAEGYDLRPVREVVDTLLDDWVRELIAEGITLVAVPSIKAWLPSLSSQPGAEGSTNVLRRAASMFDEWMRTAYGTDPGVGDVVFRGWVDVASMKAADGSIDAKYVDASTGSLNAAGRAEFNRLVEVGVDEMIKAGY